MRTLTVNGYSARWLRNGFPWVYPKEVVKGKVRPGEWVELRDERGTRLGAGLADTGWLAVRVFAFGDDEADPAALRALLARAALLRDAVIGPETTGYRLVHGENDGLPGVRIDWWSHHAVVVLDSPALAPLLPVVVEWLVETRDPRGIHLTYRTDPRDERPGQPEPPPGLLHGHEPTDDVRVLERGITYGVRPHDGPDVGLYADMRDVRAWLEPTWGGTRVVNTFAYTGAFSVSAAYNGAMETVSVDLSQKYLDRAEANFVLNELPLDAHEFLAEDTFKALDRFRRTGRRFDRVVLDPPSFSHSREGTWSAKKDLPRLVAAAARVLDPEGWVIVASNQGEMSPRDFRGLVLDGFKRAKRVAQELWVGSQGPDFPASSRFPEGRYLKVAVWRSTDVDYPAPLTPGFLIRRYKRFFADVRLASGEEVTAHLANTGKMTGCWAEGAPCRLSFHDDPKRKLAWSVEQTCIDGHWILVNTARPNRIVEEALRVGLPEIGPVDTVKREARFPEEGRADFLLDGHTWLEVKNATLREGDTIWFPDTVTARGARHLESLMAQLDRGHRAVLLLHVGTSGGVRVRPAAHLDPHFAATLDKAVARGLEVYARQVVLTETSATLGAPLPVQLGS